MRRRYRAKGLTSQGPRDLVFYNEQAGRDMSVLEYFELTYHIQCALATAQVHEPCPPHARHQAAYELMPAFSYCLLPAASDEAAPDQRQVVLHRAWQSFVPFSCMLLTALLG